MSCRAVVRVLLVGVVLIFGGEAVCILGPDERMVHVGCHAALYTGISPLLCRRTSRGNQVNRRIGIKPCDCITPLFLLYSSPLP